MLYIVHFYSYPELSSTSSIGINCVNILNLASIIITFIGSFQIESVRFIALNPELLFAHAGIQSH